MRICARSARIATRQSPSARRTKAIASPCRYYTLIPYRGKHATDGPRYKALGNSMAVPVMRWIGERIAAVEAIA